MRARHLGAALALNGDVVGVVVVDGLLLLLLPAVTGAALLRESFAAPICSPAFQFTMQKCVMGYLCYDSSHQNERESV